ncbi:hypothetical protein AX15_003906 [Amanita polypyramis BW_CC]|nr:hypothetical protein AX15_003906 [Amanita polypyramis BW_CC]
MNFKAQIQFFDISYSSSSSPYRSFDIYLPSYRASPAPPLLCFIHGGAWRSEDKRDHAAFARSLVSRANCPVVVPNYRLTPKEPSEDNVFRHPGHALDILECLTYLISWEGPPGHNNVYDPHTIHLIGHSCAAHMLSSIFLDSSSITPGLTPTATLLQSVKSIALSEGIYDIDLLLSKYPEYRSWFIAPAFGDMESYNDYSISTYALRTRDIRWLIIHSRGDTLVDLDQSKLMHSHLHQMMGVHIEGRIGCDFHSFTEQHHDLFQNDAFVGCLVKFALGD